MTKAPRRVFVVGLRGYVEVRSGVTPPTPHTTAFQKAITYHGHDMRWSPALYTYVWPTYTKVKTFEQTIMRGGRVLAVIPTRRATRLGLPRPVKGDVVELTGTDLADKLLNHSWRKKKRLL